MKKKLFIFIIMLFIMPIVALADKTCKYQDSSHRIYELHITSSSVYLTNPNGQSTIDGNIDEFSTECPESINICTYEIKFSENPEYSRVTPNECDTPNKSNVKLTTYVETIVDTKNECVYKDSKGTKYTVYVSKNDAYGTSIDGNYMAYFREFENGCPDTTYLCVFSDFKSGNYYSNEIRTGGCQNGFTSSALSKYKESNQHGGSGEDPEKPTVIEKVSCKTLFGDPNNSNEIAYWLQWAMKLIKYAGIIALLAMSTADFVKALISNDQDALKKAGTTTLKRFIYCVLLFFLPIIVDALMTLIGAYGTCNIG